MIGRAGMRIKVGRPRRDPPEETVPPPQCHCSEEGEEGRSALAQGWPSSGRGFLTLTRNPD